MSVPAAPPLTVSPAPKPMKVSLPELPVSVSAPAPPMIEKPSVVRVWPDRTRLTASVAPEASMTSTWEICASFAEMSVGEVPVRTIVSVPAPPITVSMPTKPDMMSLPAPPEMLSFPELPVIASLPPPPVMEKPSLWLSRVIVTANAAEPALIASTRTI